MGKKPQHARRSAGQHSIDDTDSISVMETIEDFCPREKGRIEDRLRQAIDQGDVANEEQARSWLRARRANPREIEAIIAHAEISRDSPWVADRQKPCPRCLLPYCVCEDR